MRRGAARGRHGGDQTRQANALPANHQSSVFCSCLPRSILVLDSLPFSFPTQFMYHSRTAPSYSLRMNELSLLPDCPLPPILPSPVTFCRLDVHTDRACVIQHNNADPTASTLQQISLTAAPPRCNPPSLGVILHCRAQSPGSRTGPMHPVVMHPSDDISQARWHTGPFQISDFYFPTPP